ncbi:energy-coupling factor transporter transmembrane component T family protein [Mycobacteroides abscessus]|uniref:Cobalt transport family protein n=1 Tax=Mycobacteroides abscessus 21 TaxID=1299324 RepID=A0A829Q475_9MYCO|nr:energy-coupling factor transporter transmembrane protein EcfT [Mycobacteroides abscessus]EUA47228.1 cobalt transport family protein [Mycobacteroides abscessus 21]MBE5492936.1 hypothetical protein [Mycobacteroides abscessus]SHO94483.1 Energy-coupling factor transporter transmembrane protein EcfT [Mycobacteroides abscessus subsp. abscessus]SHP88559.1 Energy-coupling factor transporter transmembrane protein EcfT [Mycobacteroides abscessus subsp. abscessus]SHP91798.1 Energy-coupling factor tran
MATTQTPRRPIVLGRPIPGTSPIHRLWAGTKFLSVLTVSVLLLIYPTWTCIGVLAALLLVAARLARIPRGALPTIPRWMLIMMIGTGLIALSSGGAPYWQLGPYTIGLHGALTTARACMMASLLLGTAAMVSWTTDVSDVAPAVGFLGRPLGRLGLPVNETAASITLSLRAFPMLIDEFRTLNAARKLRPQQLREDGKPQSRITQGIDILTAAITVALRRAAEMGDAITARGGTGQIAAHPKRPGLRDAAALTVVLAAATAIILIETL